MAQLWQHPWENCVNYQYWLRIKLCLKLLPEGYLKKRKTKKKTPFTLSYEKAWISSLLLTLYGTLMLPAVFEFSLSPLWNTCFQCSRDSQDCSLTVQLRRPRGWHFSLEEIYSVIVLDWLQDGEGEKVGMATEWRKSDFYLGECSVQSGLDLLEHGIF